MFSLRLIVRKISTLNFLSGSRAISTSCSLLKPPPRNVGNTFNQNDIVLRDDSITSKKCPQSFDVETAAAVESNLFDNGNSHSPVNAEELLKKFDKKERNEIRPKFKKLNTTDSAAVNIQSEKKKTSATVIDDTNLQLRYTKLGLNDPILSKLFIIGNGRKKNERRLVLEGRRIVLEALKCALPLQAIIFSEKSNIAAIADYIRDLRDVQILRIPKQDLRTWSALSTTPGLIAIFKRPDNTFAVNSKQTIPITVICDNIREPNNLGSIIRTCAALPCHQLIVTKGCCDPWDVKALRGGVGAHFYITIKDDVTWDNVSEFLPDDYSVFVAESNSEMLSHIPVIPYDRLSPSPQHNVLIIGGETHGISTEAREFSRRNSITNFNLNIPLAPGIDSLNTASALTVLLFEMRKKLFEYQLITKDHEIDEKLNSVQ